VLAYTVAQGNNPVFGPEDVWIDHPGSPPSILPVGMGDGVGSIVWSPDGSELAFDDSVFGHPATGFSPATQPLGRAGTIPVNGGSPVTAFQLSGTGIDLAGWWPEGGGLLF
jgi:hypothetical protein